MQPRIDFYTASPDGLKAMIALETAVSKLPLEKVADRTGQAARFADQRLRLFASTCTLSMPSRAGKLHAGCLP